MNGKVDFRKIGVAVVGVIAVIFGLMKGSDIFPIPETSQTEQTAQQTAEQNNSSEQSTQVVDFELDDSESPEVIVEKKETTKEEVEKVTEQEVKPKPKNVTDDSKPGNQRLTYEGKNLILTKHAKCRMNCRKISKAEVLEVIDEGKENKRKSNPNDPRCPTIALEDWTEDGQLVRIIVADCDNVAKLITVIDLKNNYDCYCK